MNINMTEILQNFIDMENKINIVILHYYKSLFTKEGIKNNYGCYMIIPIFILHIILIVIFYKKQLNYIIEMIESIIYAKKNI